MLLVSLFHTTTDLSCLQHLISVFKPVEWDAKKPGAKKKNAILLQRNNENLR
jgi:hypothetical protein